MQHKFNCVNITDKSWRTWKNKLRPHTTLMQFKDRESELQQRGKNGQSREEVANLMSNYNYDADEKTNELKELLVSTFIFWDFNLQVNYVSLYWTPLVSRAKSSRT